ncbi:MAG: hypothetical protein A2046_03495 [Bacteroidetes bacterium GWA2_30_7]|nr:MAG: hypothetical protein A2046_03495 [Bacteroidetes bacterium GWA2_30_7]
MDKEKLLKLAENPNNITGIYNYCNRWCERCSFTSKCLNFQMGEEESADTESNDINNKKFWDKLSEIFKITLEMIYEDAAKMGIDLDAIDTTDFTKKEELLNQEAENHVCATESYKYIDMVKKWFESYSEITKSKQHELTQKAELEIPGTDPIKEIENINDVCDVIHWYQYQIHIKTKRAIHGMLGNFNDDDESDYPNDSDGSAKVALIGIDDSIAAWGELMNIFPSEENEILNILVHLERLRKTIEKTFPKARAFKRAGFDD